MFRGARTRSKLNFMTFHRNSMFEITAHTRGRRYPRQLLPVPPYLRGEVHGFFEYSINVRKSYITNRECTRSRRPGACFACPSDHSYLSSFRLSRRHKRAFLWPALRRALGPPFFVPSYRSFPFSARIHLHFCRRINGLAADC